MPNTDEVKISSDKAMGELLPPRHGYIQKHLIVTVRLF